MPNCFAESGCFPARETQDEVGFPNAMPPRRINLDVSCYFPAVGVLKLMVESPQLPSNHPDSALII